MRSAIQKAGTIAAWISLSTFEFNGDKYFYAETTKNGGPIGREFSVDLKGTKANLISLHPAQATSSANSGGP